MSISKTDREALLALDRKHVWRPYTSSEEHQTRDLLAVEKAEGSWLYDLNGQRYLDACASWWCNNLGHQHPRLIKRLKEQADTLAHCTLANITHENAAKLAEELVEIAPPGLERVFYSDNGSTSVEVALKIALQYWQQQGHPDRSQIISLPGAYHGDTIGAMSVGGVDAFVSKFRSWSFEVARAPQPKTSDWDDTFTWIETYLNEHSAKVAAVIVEPLVQGAAGMRVYPKEQLTRLRAMTDRSQTLLITDEIFSGFGRSGTMWACEQAQITPDLLCSAKGLSGGMLPFAATLASERVFDAFRGGKERALLHGHTFCGNPLGASVAREVLAIYRDENIIKNLKPKAKLIAEGFESIARLPGVKSTRSLGMIGACDLGESDYLGTLGRKVHELALKRGVLLRPLGNTVYTTPPLTISQDDLSFLITTLQDCIECALSSAESI